MERIVQGVAAAPEGARPDSAPRAVRFSPRPLGVNIPKEMGDVVDAELYMKRWGLRDKTINQSS